MAPTETNKSKILVVEDEAVMRQIVVRKLLQNGFDVVEAENGLEAIEIWKEQKPSLVLLDLILPGKDGFGVLKTIRQDENPEIANTPVIVLSNLWSNQDVLKAQNLQISGYMVKAYFTTEDILSKVQGVLMQTEPNKPS